MDSFAPPSPLSSNEPPAKKTKTALDVLLGEEDTSSTPVSTCEELDLYLAEKPQPRNSQPLLWWQANGHRFPRLSPLAREILGIPATSTPSERIFSTAGLTVTKLRCCLKPSNVDTLIFLYHNWKILSESM